MLWSYYLFWRLLSYLRGPDTLLGVAQSDAQNKKAGMITALGLCHGLVVHITSEALGVSSVVYQSALAFDLVKYAGAVYLLYLAWQSFREKENGMTVEGGSIHPCTRRRYSCIF